MRYLMICSLFLGNFLLSTPSFAETLTLSTYYPAPNGRYDDMRANKMAVGTNYVLAATTVADSDLIVEGNLGVGLTAPNAFQVNATNVNEIAQVASNVRMGVGNGTPRIIFDQAGGGSQWEIDSSGGSMRFFQPGATKMTILSNGNVGIGNVDPHAKLDVRGTSAYNTENGPLIVAEAADSNKKVSIGYDNALGAGYVSALHSGVAWKNLIFQGGGGNVGIGSSSPARKLDVVGDIAANWFRSSGSTGWYSQDYGGGIYMSDTSWVRIFNSKSLWVDGVIGGNGGLTIGYGGAAAPAGGAIIAGAVGVNTSVIPAGCTLAVNGKARSLSTAGTDPGTTLATKDYVDAAAGGGPSGWTCSRVGSGSIAGNVPAVASCPAGTMMISGGCQQCGDNPHNGYPDNTAAGGWRCPDIGCGHAHSAFAWCCQ